jgi:hypothetical protein
MWAEAIDLDQCKSCGPARQSLSPSEEDLIMARPETAIPDEIYDIAPGGDVKNGPKRASLPPRAEAQPVAP